MQSCAFGYHAGGWGKPPVDENGKPLYGDVFGTQSGEFTVSINVSHWFQNFFHRSAGSQRRIQYFLEGASTTNKRDVLFSQNFLKSARK